jgi:hypothetical protein
MRRLVLALVAPLATAAAIAVTSSPVAAAQMPNQILGYDVTARATWTDPSTLQVHRYYTVTINFSHRGPTEARVTEIADGAGIDSDHAWFKGNGTDTFTGTVVGGLVGQPVHFQLILYKRGTHHALEVVDTLTIGPFSN